MRRGDCVAIPPRAPHPHPPTPAPVPVPPGKLASDLAGGRLFIADSNNHRIVATDLAGNFLFQVRGQWAQGGQVWGVCATGGHTCAWQLFPSLASSTAGQPGLRAVRWWWWMCVGGVGRAWLEWVGVPCW